MILVVGGAFQGKYDFARTLASKMEEETEIIRGLEGCLRNILLTDGDWEEYIRELTEEKKNSVIILREMGCGVVPMEKEERLLRDVAGKAGQMLAKSSEQVYRVICGIGVRIK